MPSCTVTSPEFLAFMQAVQKISDDYMKQHFSILTPPTFTFNDGKRYVRIVRNDMSNRQDGEEPYVTGRSSHCFIDKTTGDILKCAGWKAPAKGARGNIFDSASKGMNPYGANYKRGGMF